MNQNKKMDWDVTEAFYDELNMMASKFNIPLTSNFPQERDGVWLRHSADFHGQMKDMFHKFFSLVSNPRKVAIANPQEGDESATVSRFDFDDNIAVGDAVLAVSEDYGEVATIVSSVDDDIVVLDFPDEYMY